MIVFKTEDIILKVNVCWLSMYTYILISKGKMNADFQKLQRK